LQGVDFKKHIFNVDDFIGSMHVYCNFVKAFELTKNTPSPESFVETRVYDTAYAERSAWRCYLHGDMVIEPVAILSASTMLTIIFYVSIKKNVAK